MLEQQDIQMILPLMLRWILGAWFFFSSLWQDIPFRLESGHRNCLQRLRKKRLETLVRPFFSNRFFIYRVAWRSFVDFGLGYTLRYGLTRIRSHNGKYRFWIFKWPLGYKTRVSKDCALVSFIPYSFWMGRIVDWFFNQLLNSHLSNNSTICHFNDAVCFLRKIMIMSNH